MNGEIIKRRGRGWIAILIVAFVAASAAWLLLVTIRDTGPVAVGPGAPIASSANVTPTGAPTGLATDVAVAPRLPVAATVKSNDGAAAYFGYFLSVYNFSFASLDATAMEQVSTEACKFCSAVIDDVRSARAEGFRFEGSELVGTNVIVAPGDPDTGLLVNALVNQAPGRKVAKDGTLAKELPASEGVRMDAGVRWVGDGWKVFAVNLPDKK